MITDQKFASFQPRYDLFYGKVRDLGVPMRVWQEVLVERYFPVDWTNEPAVFKDFGHELQTFGDRGQYDLVRHQGMSDHDYVRSLLRQAEERIRDRDAYVMRMLERQEENFNSPSFEEEDDSAALEVYFADLETRKRIN